MLKISIELDCVIEIQAEPKEIEEHIVELTKLKAAKMNQLIVLNLRNDTYLADRTISRYR